MIQNGAFGSIEPNNFKQKILSEMLTLDFLFFCHEISSRP